MDPNETLALIRELCEKPVGLDTCEELQPLVTALDEWMSRGGFLPDDWTT